MTRPEGLFDMRCKAGREAEILAQLEIDNGLSVSWLEANRSRPAAVKRLVDSGKLIRLPCKHPSVLRFGVPVAKQHGVVRQLLGRWLS